MAEPMFEGVENLVVETLAAQDRFARNTEGVHMTKERESMLRSGHWPTEPDSRKVTRDIILAIADRLEAGMGPPEYIAAYGAVVARIRAQASTNGGDDG